jgi:hypothetical protein
LNEAARAAVPAVEADNRPAEQAGAYPDGAASIKETGDLTAKNRARIVGKVEELNRP